MAGLAVVQAAAGGGSYAGIRPWDSLRWVDRQAAQAALNHLQAARCPKAVAQPAPRAGTCHQCSSSACAGSIQRDRSVQPWSSKVCVVRSINCRRHSRARKGTIAPARCPCKRGCLRNRTETMRPEVIQVREFHLPASCAGQVRRVDRARYASSRLSPCKPKRPLSQRPLLLNSHDDRQLRLCAYRPMARNCALTQPPSVFSGVAGEPPRRTHWPSPETSSTGNVSPR